SVQDGTVAVRSNQRILLLLLLFVRPVFLIAGLTTESLQLFLYSLHSLSLVTLKTESLTNLGLFRMFRQSFWYCHILVILTISFHLRIVIFYFLTRGIGSF